MASLAPVQVAPVPGPPKITAPPRTKSFYVYLSPRNYCLCWWLVLASHVFVGSFVFSVTALHRYLQRDDVAASTSALHIPIQTLRLTARSFFLAGVGHIIAIARMIYYSVSARQLTLHRVAKRGDKPATPQSNRVTARLSVRQQASQVADDITASWNKYFGVNGYVGINGKYFEPAFMVREAMEIAMQTYQAHRLSRSVPRLWINQLAVGSIALNCISPPLIHHLLHEREGIRRLISLLMDAILDVCCAIVIPLAIILPYAQVYVTEYSGFPTELLMNDVWFVNAISSNRQVLITSMFDFFATFTPQLSILGSLMTIKNVLRRESSRVHCAAAIEPAPSSKSLLASAHGVLNVSHSGHIHMRHNLQRSMGSQRLRRIAAHVFFVVWGAVVLVLHLRAVYQTAHPVKGCQLYVPAWSSTGLACSVMFLSCYAHGFAGSAIDISAVLSKLDPSVLQVLVISHCPALEVPPIVTEFSRLIGLEIFNATIADWSMAAALQATKHPLIGYLYLIKTDFAEFPVGLLHRGLPRALTHFSTVQGNLSSIPDSLGEMWSTHPWILLSFEELPLLRELPESICKLSSRQWVFSSSGIEAFPENCMAGAVRVSASGCPLQALPTTVAFDPQDEVYILAEYANISTLPPWSTYGNPDLPPYMALFGNPVCANASWFGDETRWNRSCATNYDTNGSWYPWEYMLSQRQLVP